MNRNVQAFSWGTSIGTWADSLGLGGAEFRLPVLAGIFRFRLLDAIVINLLVSLVMVISSLVFQVGIGGLESLLPYGYVVVNLLAGSLLGSWVGVHYATVNERALWKAVVLLLICLSLDPGDRGRQRVAVGENPSRGDLRAATGSRSSKH